MSSAAASLDLLKGGKKAAVEKELAPPPPAGDDTEATIDLDTITPEQIEEVVAEYGLETPENWASLDFDARKEWLKSQADDDDLPEDSHEYGEGANNPAAKETKEEKAAKKAAKLDPKATTTKAEEPKTTDEAMAKLDTADVKPETVKKAKAKAKKEASKAVALVEPSEGKLVEVDMFEDIVHEIETISEKDARLLLGSLADQTEKTFFKIGGVLSVIQANSWFAPYGSFRDYVEKEHGILYRRAMYWIGIYNRLVESKVPYAKVKDLGWTKLKVIAEILSVENVDEWVKVAQSQTVLQLVETVKAATSPEKLLTDDTDKPATFNKTFKFHEGQKQVVDAALDKAKSEANTTVDTQALELISQEYLSAPTLTQRLKSAGIDAASKALQAAYPDAEITIELP